MQSDTMSVTAMCALTVYPSLIKSEVMVIEDESLSHYSLEEVVILLTLFLCHLFSTSYCSSSFLSLANVNMLLFPSMIVTFSHLSYIYLLFLLFLKQNFHQALSYLYSLEHFIFPFESFFCLYSS